MSIKTNNKYWNYRFNHKNRFSFVKLIASKTPYFLSNLFFSINFGSELWVVKKLKKNKHKTCLDVACGAGFRFAKFTDTDFYGVDIKDAPLDMCMENHGYIDAKPYGKDNEIPFEKKLDCASIVNLNAHVSDDLFINILDRTFESLKPNGSAYCVLELDNDSFLFRWLKKRNKAAFDKYVHGMHHYNFNKYEHVKNLLIKNEYKVVCEDPIISPLLPMSHIYFASGLRMKYKVLEYSVRFLYKIKIVDILMSILSTPFKGVNKSFLLGVEIVKKER